MTEQERFERWKAIDMGWTYENLKSVCDNQEKMHGWRYAEDSMMAKDWRVWEARAAVGAIHLDDAAAIAFGDGYDAGYAGATGKYNAGSAWNNFKQHTLPALKAR